MIRHIRGWFVTGLIAVLGAALIALLVLYMISLRTPGGSP